MTHLPPGWRMVSYQLHARHAVPSEVVDADDYIEKHPKRREGTEALFARCRDGDVEGAAAAVVKMCADVNGVGYPSCRTPLGEAAAAGSDAVARFLIEGCGADTGPDPVTGSTALHHVASTSVAARLIAATPGMLEVREQRKRRTPLEVVLLRPTPSEPLVALLAESSPASVRGEALEELLQQQQQPQHRLLRSLGPLSDDFLDKVVPRLFKSKCFSSLQALAEAYPEALPPPLLGLKRHIASNNASGVKRCLRSCEPSALGAVFREAVVASTPEVCFLLLAACPPEALAEPDRLTGETALMIVCSARDPGVWVKFVRRLGRIVSLDDVDNEGRTALHRAAARGAVPLVRALLSLGASTFIPEQHPSVEELLLSPASYSSPLLTDAAKSPCAAADTLRLLLAAPSPPSSASSSSSFCQEQTLSQLTNPLLSSFAQDEQ